MWTVPLKKDLRLFLQNKFKSAFGIADIFIFCLYLPSVVPVLSNFLCFHMFLHKKVSVLISVFVT